MDALDTFLLLVALPAVVLLSLIEAWVLSRRAAYDWRAAGVSLLDLAIRVPVQMFVRISIAAPLLALAYRWRLGHIALTGWATVLALFLGQEFCYYWYHRAAHRVRWFWCNHAVHHSPNELTLVAAFRIGFLGQLSGVAGFFAPLVWLGFSPRIVFQVLSINLLYQFWIHATWIPRLGWLEYVFNTPSAHRVHHARNLEYLDANYGGVLIVFDRLFGTYRAERAGLPCRYGLVTPVATHNPLRIEFGRWAELGRDLAHDVFRARSPRAVLGHLLMPPGWSPDGRHQRTEDLRRAATGAEPGA
ncbi:MAG: sterol desaturase family protein [Pseudomonadota bacterium]